MVYRNRKWLQKQYVGQKRSTLDIARECECDPQTISNWLKKFDIPRRSIQEAHSKGKLARYTDCVWLKNEYVSNERTASKIAKMCGVTHATILNWLDKHNIPRRNRSESSKIRAAKKIGTQKYRDPDWLKQRYVIDGLTVRDIATQIGCSFPTILHWLERHNIDRRPVASELSGEDHPSWNGGGNSLSKSIRSWQKYSDWRSQVLAKDGASCQKCGNTSSLEVDHIVPLSYLLIQYGITSAEKALTCDPLWDVGNGRVLCVSCHRNTDTYGKGARAYDVDSGVK